tara:strand:+ start:9045 stop:9899 length:855 start_codon:yes stop_codon:yes gene_type:complete
MSFDLDEAEPWSFNEKRMLKYMLEQDGIQFMRYFFKHREGMKMLRNWHHYAIEYVLQAVYDMKVPRLIVNIAPGYSKTEQVVLNFIARGIALNPRAKFIHASYSGDLAHENSAKIKEMVGGDEFQELWPMKIRVDSKGKKRWFTEMGGGMMAAPAGGQITGFRAGRMEPGFTGAFVIDDPVKPDDAYSAVKRNAINNRFNNTMRSRLAVEEVPMVVIMQRIHEEDLSGYLLKGGSGDVWHHLTIPTSLSAEALDKPYPEDYTHGIPISLDGVLAALRGGPKYDF